VYCCEPAVVLSAADVAPSTTTFAEVRASLCDPSATFEVIPVDVKAFVTV